MEHPDAEAHLRVSIAKSILRIFGGIVLCSGVLWAAGLLFIIDEILGIIEEIV